MAKYRKYRKYRKYKKDIPQELKKFYKNFSKKSSRKNKPNNKIINDSDKYDELIKQYKKIKRKLKLMQKKS